MDVSIVIVSYNCKTYLKECLFSILKAPTTLKLEIIVVDNASADSTIEEVCPLFPDVQFLRNEKNFGFAAANNQGIALAIGEYILFLNPDILVHDNSIDEMVSFLRANADVGACGTRLLNHDGSVQASYFDFPSLLKEAGHLMRLDQFPVIRLLATKIKNFCKSPDRSFHEGSSAPFKVDYLLGACCMVPKYLIDKYGGMDERIFMYIEDTELCYRLGLNGYSTYYLPWGAITHFGGQSSLTADSRMFSEYTKSKLYFFKKAHGSYYSFPLKLIIIIDLIFKSLEVLCWGGHLEMQKLQTRYKNLPLKDTTQGVSRGDSLKLYLAIAVKIFKM